MASWKAGNVQGRRRQQGVMAEPQRRRIVAIDVVRGLAIVGMLLVNDAGIPAAMPRQLRLAPSTGVLQQIAGAYLLAWLALKLPRGAQLPAGAAVLAGLWAAYAFVPADGVRPDSWAPGTNLADFVDRHMLGQFSEHGVLVMVASSVTVLTGVAAGRVLRDRQDGSGVTERLSA